MGVLHFAVCLRAPMLRHCIWEGSYLHALFSEFICTFKGFHILWADFNTVHIFRDSEYIRTIFWNPNSDSNPYAKNEETTKHCRSDPLRGRCQRVANHQGHHDMLQVIIGALHQWGCCIGEGLFQLVSNKKPLKSSSIIKHPTGD